MEWKDTTSYRRDAERVPTAWTTHIGRLRITITCAHIYYPGRWVFHCQPFFDTYELKGAETKEQAQEMALTLVKKEIDAIIADIESAQ